MIIRTLTKSMLIGSAVAMLAGCVSVLDDIDSTAVLQSVQSLPTGVARAAEPKDIDRTPNAHITSPEDKKHPNDHYRRISFELSGKIRDKPVDPSILSVIERIADDMKVNIIVVSGGQDAKGTGNKRTGSIRHDVNSHGLGQATDIVLVKNGVRLSPDKDVETHAAFIRAAAERLPGIGHYSWGLHVGYGKEAFWGPDLSSHSANPILANAFWQGRKLAK